MADTGWFTARPGDCLGGRPVLIRPFQPSFSHFTLKDESGNTRINFTGLGQSFRCIPKPRLTQSVQ